MDWAFIGVVAIISIVAAGAFANRLGVAAPLILIVIGVGFSFIPGAPTVVPPEIILAGILPPILYSSAVNVPIVDFRRNFSSIFGLSVLLVLVSAFATGWVLFTLFPKLTFAEGVALGAVISPTDAVAATAIGKRLGLPPRLVTILEGEGLVNDATALVLLRSAVVAVTQSVSFWGSLGDFAYAVIIAIVIGLLVGAITVWVRAKFSDSVLDTAISFAVPFLAYIPAERIHGSGVIAVVVAGLYSGHAAAKRFTPQARISERLNWRTIQFVLENGVFLLMGLEISKLVENVQTTATSDEPGVFGSVLLGLLATALLIVLRVIFVPPLLVFVRSTVNAAERQQSRFRRRLDQFIGLASGALAGTGAPKDARYGTDRAQQRIQQAEKSYTQRENDLEQRRAEEFGWRGAVVLSWSGMRGVVTLAAAQSLPETFHYRAQLVLIAFTVAVVTLLFQGGTLPLIIRLTKIKGSDQVADRRSLAQLLEEISTTGVGVLENPSLKLPDGSDIPGDVIEKVRADSQMIADTAWERADHGTGDDELTNSPRRQYRELRREVLAAEREALLEARSSGAYPSRILNRAQTMLDFEETRLEAMDNQSGF
jgi:NhaP-type Na+/H+ or K+/H+ antiporter